MSFAVVLLCSTKVRVSVCVTRIFSRLVWSDVGAGAGELWPTGDKISYSCSVQLPAKCSSRRLRLPS